MTIDLVLIYVQSIFLILYSLSRVIQPQPVHKKELALATLVFLGIAIASFFAGDAIKSNLQLILLMLLALDYVISILNNSGKHWQFLPLFSAIITLSYFLIYLHWDHILIRIASAVLIVVLFGLIKKWPKWFKNNQIYFRKSGTLLTLFFLLEPVLQSIQQNMKPISTIPINHVLNLQSFLLVGALLLLILGGFLWKEKQDIDL